MGIFGGRKARMRKWVTNSRALLSQIPRPADYPQAHAAGPDADRILLFGSGRFVGWGATTHNDAMPGALSIALSDMTLRGTDVDLVAAAELTVADARSRLFGAKLWRFDVIVVNIGLLDAMLLLEPEEWAAALTTLLDDIERAAAEHTRVVLLGIESVASISAYAGARAAEADHHARKLDAMSREIVAGRSRTTFVRLDADPTDYKAQAEELADSLLELLDLARGESPAVRGPAGQDAAQRENERLAGVHSTGILDTPPEGRFDRIVTMARQLYGTSGAALAIVDADRVWHKAASEGVPTEVARDQSFCSTTIMQRGAHVVPDMLLDGAPDDNAAASDIGIRFYAGYPVESPSGEQIGALCIFDAKPRDRDDVDDTMLRQLALLVQAELQVDALSAR